MYSADGFLLGSRDSSRYASAPVPVKLQVNAEKLLPPAPVKETLSSGILGFLVSVILLDKVEDSKIQKDTSRVFSFPLGKDTSDTNNTFPPRQSAKKAFICSVKKGLKVMQSSS